MHVFLHQKYNSIWNYNLLTTLVVLTTNKNVNNMSNFDIKINSNVFM